MNQTIIKRERPPQWIWERAHALFDIDDVETIYTYDDVIYDPRPKEDRLSGAVIAHEKTHMEQQMKEGGADSWWRKYFIGAEFRKTQEVEAYTRQYRYYCNVDKDRNNQARYLDILATIASSPMYKMNLTKSDAIKLIRKRK